MAKKPVKAKSKAVVGRAKKKWSFNLSKRSALFGLVGIMAFSIVSGFGYQKWQDHQLKAQASAGGTYLLGGQCLKGGQSIFSSSKSTVKRSKLTMRKTGNLVITNSAGKVVWQTGTNTANSVACMKVDGDFVITNPAGQMLWHSWTEKIGAKYMAIAPLQTYGLHFTTETSTDIKITYMTKSSPIPNSFTSSYWRSNYGNSLHMSYNNFTTLPEGRSTYETMPRDTSLVSTNGKYRAQYQPEGILIIYNATLTAIWSIGGELGGNVLGFSSSYNHAFAIGNSLMENGTVGNIVWSAPNPSSSNDYVKVMTMQDDGNLVVYSNSGQALWSSGTAGR